MQYNKFLFAGFLTRDPELRYTQTGKPVCQFSVASNRSWTDRETNERREEATFLDVTAFGRTAETVSQHFKKGKAIFVEGRMQNQAWEDRETREKRYKMAFILESFSFVNSGRERTDSEPAEPTMREKIKAAAGTDTRPDPEDDVPF